jgi:hypothetical protein
MRQEDLAKLLLTEAEFMEFFSAQVEWVEKCVGDGDQEEWVPHLSVMTQARPEAERQIELYCLYVDFNTPEEKQGYLRHLGRKLYQEQRFPLAVVLTCEAWRSSRGDMAPADDPAREEVLVASGLSLGRRHAAATSMPITRTAGGPIQPATFEPPATGGEVGLPLVDSFFHGFFEATARQMGVNLEG